MTFKLQVPQRIPRTNPAPRPAASFGEVVGAAYGNEIIDADIRNYGQQVERRILTDIADRLGSEAPEQPMGQPIPGGTIGLIAGLLLDQGAPGVYFPADRRADLLRRAAIAEQRNPAAWADLPTSDAAVQAESVRRRQAEARDNLDTLSMGGDGIGQMGAEITGTMGATITDPLLQPLLLAGAGAGGLARTMAIEGGLGATFEVAKLPDRARVAQELGRPDLTLGDMATRVAIGAGFGAGFGGLIHGAQRGAAYIAGRRTHTRDTAPPGVEAGDHGAAVDAAEEALRNGQSVPPPSPVVDQADIARVTGKIIGVESGGRAAAQNPNSTAGGLGQIIDSTWLELIGRHRPDLAQTKTRAELLAMKGDGPLNRSMTEAYTGENVAALNAAQIPATDGNVYLSHFLGPGGARVALLADPDAPISAVMSAGAIEANKSLTYAGRAIQHWTVRDLRRWSEVKMGQAVDPGDAYTAATRRGYTSGSEVVTPAGTRVTVEYEIVDLDTLILASGDRQPRDRSRAAPTAKVAERAAALDPAQLLPSPLAGSGPPIVGADNIIDSGNGRAMSIIHAADNFGDRYSAYLDGLRAAGFEIPAGMNRPVLIARRTTDLPPDELRRFVREANDDVVERLSPSEQARTDATALTPETLGLFDPEAPSIGSPENRAFLSRVVAGLPASQQGSVMDSVGRLTPAGATRIQGAMLAHAFDAPDLIEAATEAAGAEIKSLLDALTDVAPAWAQMRAEAAAGRGSPEFDITSQVVEAVRLIRDARAIAVRDGVPVRAAIADALAQGDMFSGGVNPITARLVGIAYRDGRAQSRDAVAGALRSYVTEAQQIGGGGGGGLLDDIAPASPLDVLDGVRARADRSAPPPPREGEPAAAEPVGPAGVSVIDVEGADGRRFAEGATSPAAQAGADQAEASLRARLDAAPGDGQPAATAAPGDGPPAATAAPADGPPAATAAPADGPPAPAAPQGPWTRTDAKPPADDGAAAILNAGDFEIEPGVTASEVLKDLADDAEFMDIVNLCGLGGVKNG
jgi:hypothetical protein